jgi:hypothetical protein
MAPARYGLLHHRKTNDIIAHYFEDSPRTSLLIEDTACVVGPVTWLVQRSMSGLPRCVCTRLPPVHQTWHQKWGLVQSLFAISTNSTDKSTYSYSLSNALFRPGKIIIHQKQPEHAEHFKYLSTLITNDARRKREIISRIVMAKAAFNKNNYHQQIGLKFKEDTREKLDWYWLIYL